MKSKGTNFTLKQKNVLTTLGENIKLARLRRKLSIRSMAERAGIATSTLGNIEDGSPSVSLGSYLQVLSVLRLEDDLLLIADKDPVGRQIQDAGLKMIQEVSMSDGFRFQTTRCPIEINGEYLTSELGTPFLGEYNDAITKEFRLKI